MQHLNKSLLQFAAITDGFLITVALFSTLVKGGAKYNYSARRILRFHTQYATFPSNCSNTPKVKWKMIKTVCTEFYWKFNGAKNFENWRTL